MRAIGASLLAFAGVSSVSNAAPISESRPSSAYQGDWQGVQWGDKLWNWRGSTIAVKRNGSTANGANFFRSGDIAIRSISTTSTSYTAKSYGSPTLQVFTAECLVRRTAEDTSQEYVPCHLVLDDSDPAYPPVRKRFEVRIVNDGNDIKLHNLKLSLPHGFFDRP